MDNGGSRISRWGDAKQWGGPLTSDMGTSWQKYMRKQKKLDPVGGAHAGVPPPRLGWHFMTPDCSIIGGSKHQTVLNEPKGGRKGTFARTCAHTITYHNKSI